MDIGFVWDEEKYKRVHQKHDVLFWEVVSALMEDKYELWLWDQTDESRRIKIIAQTHTGRVLTIVLIEIVDIEESAILYRIITAYDAEGRDLYEYHEQRR